MGFSPKTIRGFAVVYALLFLVLIGSGLGAYAAYNIPPLKHDVKVAKESLGDQNLGRLATQYIARIAKAQGYTAQRMTVVKVVSGGDAAVVTVEVVLADPTGATQNLKLAVTFRRGVWNATGAAAA